MLLGDFNIDIIADGKGKTADNSLLEFCCKFCLNNQMTEPTRITENSRTLIDDILVGHPERYASCRYLCLGVSDHDLMSVVKNE